MTRYILILFKAIYFGYGVNEVLEANCKNLEKKIQVGLQFFFHMFLPINNVDFSLLNLLVLPLE